MIKGEKAVEQNKEPFLLEYTAPLLDWYTTVRVEIKWDEYHYFKIQYRFGSTYWLMGYKEKDGRFEREEVTIGRIYRSDLGKFIKWCEYDDGRSSKLIGVSVISTGMNITKIMKEIISLSDGHDK